MRPTAWPRRHVLARIAADDDAAPSALRSRKCAEAVVAPSAATTRDSRRTRFAMTRSSAVSRATSVTRVDGPALADAIDAADALLEPRRDSTAARS